MERMAAAVAPYCGAVPLPEQLLSRWNFDPVLLCALAGLPLAAKARPSGGRRTALLAGAATLLGASISPLCALSSGLFSARSLHHLLLVAAAGPLLGYVFPRPRPPLGPLAAFHILIFWFWHLPEAYGAALADAFVYWLMQLSLLCSAALLWSRLFAERLGSTGIVALVTLMGQMGLLGALLTFADRPLYAPHFLTTSIFGITPLEDQQLAGLIMWVLSLPLYALAALPFLSRLLRTREAAA